MAIGSHESLELSKVAKGVVVVVGGSGIVREKGKMDSWNMTFLETKNSLVFMS